MLGRGIRLDWRLLNLHRRRLLFCGRCLVHLVRRRLVHRRRLLFWCLLLLWCLLLCRRGMLFWIWCGVGWIDD